MRPSLTPKSGFRLSPLQRILLGGATLLGALALAWMLMKGTPEHDPPLHTPKIVKRTTTDTLPSPR